MTIAEDKKQFYNNTSATPSVSYTPTGTAAGVLVLVAQESVDAVTAVAWGGKSLTEITESPQVGFISGGEDVTCSAWFLGDASEIALRADDNMVFTVDAIEQREIGIYTFTADGDTEIVDSYGETTGPTNKTTGFSTTLALGGDTCYCALVVSSGTSATTGITPATNWTADDELDFGAAVGGIYGYDIVASTDVTATYTQSNDDGSMIAVAIKDSGGAVSGPPSGSLGLLGVGV